MYNLLTLAILVIFFLGILAYMGKEQTRRDKVEKDRFREFVLATKSEDVHEYSQVVVDEGELPTEEVDELVDLDQVEPEQLLRALKTDENK